MWHDLWVAVCLVLVIEGILPFVNPRAARELMLTASRQEDRMIRWAGLASMVVGALSLYLIN